MSLHVLANHMASKGRNGDSMLVHMTPGEVHGLQALAMKHGGTLTINPHTGLPEASFLKSLLPMLAGVALDFVVPGLGEMAGLGLSGSQTAGLLVGGATGLATGSLSKGLMAGLGAYGGFGLGESLLGAGTGALSSQITGEIARDKAAEIASGQLGEEEVNKMVSQRLADTSAFSKAGAGLSAITQSPSTAMDFAKANWKPLAAAAAPIMADQMIPTTTKMSTPAPATPSYIRQKLYDPYTQTYKSLAPVDASKWGTRNFSDAYTNPQTGEVAMLQPRQTSPMATGGIVALANGGAVQHFDGGGVTDAQIFDYFKGLDQGQLKSGALDQQIARDMDTYKVSAADIARATGTQNQAADYANRYTAADTKNDIYDYFANANTQAQLKAGNDAAIANTLAANNWSLANVAAATGTQGQLGDYATRFVKAEATPTTDASEFLAAANAVGLQNQNLATALQNSGLSAADQYALTHNLADTSGITGTSFYNNLGYTTGALPGDQGGLEGLYANINYSATGLQNAINSGKMTVQQAQDAALAEMARSGVSLADIAKATGKTIGTLFTPKKADDKTTDKTTTTSTITGGTGNDTLVDHSGEHWDGTKWVKNTNATQNTTTTVTTPTSLITAPSTSLPVGVSGTTGPSIFGGGATVNPNGTITTSPVIPGIPVGGFTGMEQVRNAYTTGGGSLGYTSPVVKNMAEHDAMYNRQTGDSLAAYNYLMGKGAYPTQSVAANTATGIQRPYWSSAMKYKPKFLSYDKDGNVVSSDGSKTTPSTTGTTGTTKVLNADGSLNQEATDKANFDYVSYLKANPDVQAELDKGIANFGTKDDLASAAYNHYLIYGKAANRPLKAAAGGMMGYSVGGGLGTLGGYSDGGRLLKGPGDGVSDSIPATIGAKQQPARLADGEFVVPARIVSELGNGSTDAGAKKLYAMMDRVQRARGKTTGKNKVAANSGADKYLPA
jgi:hypothetical protein